MAKSAENGGDFAEIVSRGDRLASLKATRDALAVEMVRLQKYQTANEAAGRDFAVMTKELCRIMAEIDEVDSVSEGDSVDELTKRRNERRASS